MVVVSLLEVVPAHDPGLAVVCIVLPLGEVQLVYWHLGETRTLRKSTFLRSFFSWCLSWRTMARSTWPGACELLCLTPTNAAFDLSRRRRPRRRRRRLRPSR